MKVRIAGEGRNFNLLSEIKSEIVFSGERLMFLLVDLKPGQIVPMHKHPHEQMGICLRGHAEFSSEGQRIPVKSGSFYWIKPNEPHSLTVIAESTFLDVFSPPRDDYLSEADAQEKRNQR